MAAHNDDDGNENIAKDEFVSFQTLPIWNCINYLSNVGNFSWS